MKADRDKLLHFGGVLNVALGGGRIAHEVAGILKEVQDVRVGGTCAGVCACVRGWQTCPVST